MNAQCISVNLSKSEDVRAYDIDTYDASIDTGSMMRRRWDMSKAEVVWLPCG